MEKSNSAIFKKIAPDNNHEWSALVFYKRERMADPSIQTFCCHKPRMGNPSVSLMSEFNSTTYNIVCLVSSVLGCLGAIYQVIFTSDF